MPINASINAYKTTLKLNYRPEDLPVSCAAQLKLSEDLGLAVLISMLAKKIKIHQ